MCTSWLYVGGRLASELLKGDVWRSPEKGVVVEVVAVTIALQAPNCILQGMSIMRYRILGVEVEALVNLMIAYV